jgi:hypothetical protein
MGWARRRSLGGPHAFVASVGCQTENDAWGPHLQRRFMRLFTRLDTPDALVLLEDDMWAWVRAWVQLGGRRLRCGWNGGWGNNNLLGAMGDRRHKRRTVRWI